MKKIGHVIWIAGIVSFFLGARMSQASGTETNGLLLCLAGFIQFLVGVIVASTAPKTISRSFNKRGEALVETVRNTGVYRGRPLASLPQPQVEMILSYQTELGQEITTKVCQFVPNNSILPGITVPIRYRENNPKKVMVDFEDRLQDSRQISENYPLSSAAQALKQEGERLELIYSIIHVVSFMIGFLALVGSIAKAIVKPAVDAEIQSVIGWLSLFCFAAIFIGFYGFLTKSSSNRLTAVLCAVCIVVITYFMFGIVTL